MRSGDPCDRCAEGTMNVYSTRRLPGGEWKTRYLRCDSCGATGQQTIKAGPLRKRSRKSVAKLANATAGTVPLHGKIKHQPNGQGEPAMFVTIDQIAERSSVSRWTVIRWIREGAIPVPTVIGDYARWTEATIQSWLSSGCPRSAPPDAESFVRIRKLDRKELREILATKTRVAERVL